MQQLVAELDAARLAAELDVAVLSRIGCSDGQQIWMQRLTANFDLLSDSRIGCCNWQRNWKGRSDFGDFMQLYFSTIFSGCNGCQQIS